MCGKMLLMVLAVIQLPKIGATLEFPECKFNVSSLIFPKGFIFSSATASYQIEGAWNVEGKGENIWDRLVHTNPTAVANNETGDIACDSYHRFKEDVQNMKAIGFKMYRFSISWSRIFPNGFVSEPNFDGVRYYNEVIDELLRNGIEPMVTMYHWDLPQPLQDKGGWLNATIADIFADYAREVFKLFGPKVKWWVTINEPLLVTKGYGEAGGAPLFNLHGYGEYLSGHNLLRAHAKAYRIYDKEFRSSQKGKVSLVLNGSFMFPKNSSNHHDVTAAERGNQFTVGWFGHPIYSEDGNYPPVMRDYVDRHSHREGLKRSRLPYFTKLEIQEIKGSYDYFALNHYTSRLASSGLSGPKPSIYRDQEVKRSISLDWQKSACDWLQVVPEGLRGMLQWIKKEYNNPEIFITENGYCGSDIDDDDASRIDYHQKYLNEILGAMKEGSRIVGYTVWSLMDNFEWQDGYTKKFGIIKVDFSDPNLQRAFKKSASFFKRIIKKNSLKWKI